MIKNERQFKITNKWLREFTKSLKEVGKSEIDVDPLLIQLEGSAIKSQIDEFKRDISEYKRLKVRKRTPIKSIFHIGKALISARIMNKLTQKQLANKLKLKEQQIQRWEEEEYSKCALHTIFEVATVLNLSSSTFCISINKSTIQK